MAKQGDFNPDKAMAQGIPVGDVIDSWSHHLVKQRDELRQRELSGQARDEAAQKTVVTIKQHANGAGVHWEVLGMTGVEAHELEHLPRVSATSLEAARNKVSVHELLDMRLRKKLLERLVMRGRHGRDYAARLSAQDEVLGYEVFVADVGLS